VIAGLKGRKKEVSRAFNVADTGIKNADAAIGSRLKTPQKPQKPATDNGGNSSASDKHLADEISSLRKEVGELSKVIDLDSRYFIERNDFEL